MTLSIFHAVIALFHGHTLAGRRSHAQVHDAVLSRARRALCAGRLELPAALIEELDQSAARDPVSLNLLGLIAEAHNDWPEARRCWGKALRIDPSYEPAHDNLRRWFELAQLGFTRIKIAYGDTPPSLRKAQQKRST